MLKPTTKSTRIPRMEISIASVTLMISTMVKSSTLPMDIPHNRSHGSLVDLHLPPSWPQLSPLLALLSVHGHSEIDRYKNDLIFRKKVIL